MASEALEVSQSLLGTENPVTLQCMWALSLAYSCQFRLGEAEDLLKETVRVSQHLLGKEHFQTLRYIQHLAFVRIKQGRIDEARRLLTKVLEGRRRLLGEDHGWVLGAVGWMMNLYAMQGRSDELRNWCSEEIKRLGSQLGNNRNAVVSIYTMLARIQSSYPDPRIRSGSEAMENATRACELTNRRDWPCIAALAEANAEAGDFASAVKWHIEAIDLAMSEPHIRALDEALLQWRLKLYKARRPYREGFFSFEGYYLLAEGNYEGAERALTEALEHSRQVLGERHPETRGCMIALAELYEAWGKPEKAEEWRAKLAQTEAVEE